VIVLVEDERQQRLVYHYLKRLGYRQHDATFHALPAGQGSGEQYVRNHYADEVLAYRERSAKAKSALVVAIDADTAPVHIRFQQLAKVLTKAGADPRSDTEIIAILIPKRNIETWICCLSGRDVDEETNYKATEGIENLIAPAALSFFNRARPNAVTPANCIPSLTTAISEIQRLESA